MGECYKGRDFFPFIEKLSFETPDLEQGDMYFPQTWRYGQVGR
jgi:hypothetical protein